MRFSKFLPILLLVIMFAHACTPSVHIYKRSQMLMGTVVEITVVAQDEERAEEAMTASFKEIRRLEEIMSTYIPSSDISKVNAAAGLYPVKVHRDLILVVKKDKVSVHLDGIKTCCGIDLGYIGGRYVSAHDFFKTPDFFK